MVKAAVGHRGKDEVVAMLSDKERYRDELYDDLVSGDYIQHITYKPMKKKGKNGKVRNLMSPSLYTRVLQIIWCLQVGPSYARHDPGDGLNCKKGCGVTATTRKHSVVKRLKHIFYDRRDLQYGLVMDQRKCYEHLTRKVFLKKVRKIIKDRWLVDFGNNVVFTPDGKFPIGTPSSPLAHHIVMLDMDSMVRSMAPVHVRYADNVFLAARTKEELQEAKWRLKNWWWYDLNIRAKSQETRIFCLDEGLDFCGYVFHRNPDKRVTDHNKGFTKIRQSIATSAMNCKNNDSWASYFGQLKHGDCFSLIQNIEKDMKLQQLSQKIRINRQMDAPKIDVRELADNKTTFNIYDYEIRRDKDGKANWIKCLIGMPEVIAGQPTGKILAREFHGNYSCLIEAMEAWEKEFGKNNMLPIEDAVIENQCGFIFKGSTNQLVYIEE